MLGWICCNLEGERKGEKCLLLKEAGKLYYGQA